MQYYRDFIDFLQKYEDGNLKKATPDDPFTSLLQGHGDGKMDLKEELTKTVSLFAF